MGKVKIRHLVAKPQKGGHTLFYWQPSRDLRKAGFLPRRLAERTNSLADAVQEAEALNRDLDAWRMGTQPTQIAPNTLPWLTRLYRNDSRYTELAAKTRRSYDQCIESVLDWSARAQHPPVHSVSRQHVRSFYRSMQRTPAKANAVMRVLRLLLQFGVDEGMLSDNPAAKQRLRGRPPRETVWSANQVSHLCQIAEAEGRSSMALAVLLAANLGQREGDILKLAWSQYDGDSITLRQGKTGRLIRVPVIEELRDALTKTVRRSPNIVVSEATGRPYKEDNFRHVFAEIRKTAGLSDLWFMDLRRTAVVWLAEAGCQVPEIAAITGHSLNRTSAILEVYLPRNSRMAENAIAKLSEYRRRTKLEV